MSVASCWKVRPGMGRQGDQTSRLSHAAVVWIGCAFWSPQSVITLNHLTVDWLQLLQRFVVAYTVIFSWGILLTDVEFFFFFLCWRLNRCSLTVFNRVCTILHILITFCSRCLFNQFLYSMLANFTIISILPSIFRLLSPLTNLEEMYLFNKMWRDYQIGLQTFFLSLLSLSLTPYKRLLRLPNFVLRRVSTGCLRHVSFVTSSDRETVRPKVVSLPLSKKNTLSIWQYYTFSQLT